MGVSLTESESLKDALSYKPIQLLFISRRCPFLTPNSFASPNLLSDNGPCLLQKERALKSFEHVQEHLIGHSESQLVVLEELPSRGIPPSEHGPRLTLFQVPEGPSDEICAGCAPGRCDHLGVMGHKCGKLVKAA